MKVFVYSKKTSKKIVEIKQVKSVTEYNADEVLVISTYSGETFEFNTNKVKTTSYQN